MCAIGRNQDTSVGANSPATTMLGSASIGGSLTPKRKPGAVIGTLLTGTGSGGPGGPREGSGGGGSGREQPNPFTALY
jgi:hypothetical protein